MAANDITVLQEQADGSLKETLVTAAGRGLLLAATVQAQRTALDTFVAAANLAAIQALTGNFQRVYVAQDTGKIYAWSGTGSVYTELSPFPPVEVVVACSDETSNLVAGVKKVTFRAPCAFTLTGVRASVNTAPAGAPILIDVSVNAVSVIQHIPDISLNSFSSLRIDANTKSSLLSGQATFLTAATSIANDAEITIDIDQVGASSAGKGLKVVLLGTRV
jgi:hypothetical protein